MQKRAERFNVPVSLESKKAARAARFGISSVPSKGPSSDTKPMVNLDKLKERAQRFGLNVSSISRKVKYCVFLQIQQCRGYNTWKWIVLRLYLTTQHFISSSHLNIASIGY
ncbi:SAP domain-containing ribonucleoprotein-like [Talpa occidentalis]|nr:SAP domain-containing ribonucleoprotein-like [Talpa occidentalis]